MQVPFVDLKAQYRSIQSEVDAAISAIVSETAFIGGEAVRSFETSYAAKLGARHCIGVANGTDALFLAMKALGIGTGDQVITVANSFIASSEAISATGARPVFIDCDEKTYTIDIQKLSDYLQKNHTAAIKAIIPVHLYGRPAEMGPIMELAKKYNLRVIEDCAQSHFSRYQAKNTGTIGDVGCFSFYPGKNLGAYGDAGALVTSDDELAQKIRMLANHGRIDKYDHKIEGYNSRLDGLQAAVLNIKLKHIDAWSKARYQVALWYQKYLGTAKNVVLPEIPAAGEHVFHLFVVRVKDRSAVQARLQEKGIASGVHYPIALPNLQAYRYLGHQPADFPVASRLQNEILSLPMYPELTEEMVKYVAETLMEITG